MDRSSASTSTPDRAIGVGGRSEAVWQPSAVARGRHRNAYVVAALMVARVTAPCVAVNREPRTIRRDAPLLAAATATTRRMVGLWHPDLHGLALLRRLPDVPRDELPAP